MIKRTYRVKTAEKKNVYITTHYDMPDEGIAAGKSFTMQEMYRWGNCIVVTENEELNAEDYSYVEPFVLTDYEILDQDSEDGCSLEFEFGDDWTDEEKQYVEDLFDRDSFSGLDDNGIYISDSDTEYYGPIEIELIEKVKIPDGPAKQPAKAWPF